ncbi:hypothetical protein BU15DRAFT_73995 [Melanogaster broomeanus]|nr:hypothetical protein BU15DRAFT_73995 [Melanogaster broomeanus]
MSTKDDTWFVKLSPNTPDYAVGRYILSGSPVTGDKNSVLHWRIFISCVSQGRSMTHVKLDLSPGGDGSTGVLIVNEIPYEISATSVAAVSEVATAGITVDGLLDMLKRNGRNRYRFDDSGSGCRFWCRTVLADLENGGLVASGAVERFDAYIVGKNRGNPGRFPWRPARAPSTSGSGHLMTQQAYLQ